MGIGKEAGEAAAATYNRAPALAAIVIATAALVLGLAFRLLPSGRVDAYTGTMAREDHAEAKLERSAMEARLKKGMANEIEDLRRERQAFWSQHLAHPHSGVAERLATLEASLSYIKDALKDIKTILNGGK